MVSFLIAKALRKKTPIQAQYAGETNRALKIASAIGKTDILTEEPVETNTTLRIAYISISVSIVYIILSYTLHFSLVGLYTDFITGLFIFTYCDIVFISRYPGAYLARYYRTARAAYNIFNLLRCSAWLFIGLMTMSETSITFPGDNMRRTGDRLVFDKYYVNSTTYRTSEGFRELTTVSKKIGPFKMRVLTPRSTNGQDLTHSYIKQFGQDSVLIDFLSAFIYRRDGKYYYSDIFEGEQQL